MMMRNLQKVERVKLQSLKLRKVLKEQRRLRLTALKGIRRRMKVILPVFSLLGRCRNLQR